MKVLCCVTMMVASLLLVSCGQEGALYLPAGEKKPVVQKESTPHNAATVSAAS